MEMLRDPAACPTELPLRPVVPPLALLALLPPAKKRSHQQARSFCSSGAPDRTLRDGDDRASQVPGRPPCPHAPLSDPGGTSAPGHLLDASVLPSASARYRRLPQLLPFRGSTTRPTNSLSTLRNVGPPTPRKTRFRLAANLCRAGVNTRWVSQEGFQDVFRFLHLFLLLQA